MTALPLIGPATAPDLHLMTFNIRRRIPHLSRRNPDLWTRRQPAMRQLLATEQPTILGVQEALSDQLAFVTTGLGPAYRSVGFGHAADRGGEHCAIIYDSDRLQVVGWTQRALSDTPEAPGSRSWGNLVPRVVVSADLLDVVTGVRWRVLNTHLDHLSRKSRLRSARMLAELAAMAEGPTALMGDFNSGAGSEPYRVLTAPGLLSDSWTVSDERVTEPWGTFSRYRQPRVGGRRLDWLLVSNNVAVRSSAINAFRHAGAAASDHVPVQALVRDRTDEASGAGQA